ncbi:hypothetical protein DSM104443_02468 [Usitatibacter rugosus]|uniref:Uncharacterized protein n=1 Tax=Usitatibacter rugosus TaxID=2732067 RepID=A0A6M4GYC3_9PROT|nr:hypothetical protein [Usitatibacter rugosus]QJR11393.1 hypothetical protein DSM104443_02468 [Usitatibacter rugosus]
MNRLTAIGLASLVAWGVLIATKYAGFAPASAGDRAPARVTATEGKLTVGESAVLPVVAEPRAAASIASANRIQTVKASAASLEFRAATDLKAYADQLLSRRATLNADERYHLAKTLEECQFVASMNEDLIAYAAKQRRLFLAGLPAGDALNGKRIAAFEASDNTQRCARFQGTKIAAKDIESLYADAAQQGDPRAQARMFVADLNKHNNGVPGSSKPPGDTSAGQRVDGSSELNVLIGLLETHDPEAVVTVGQVLSTMATTQQIRIGPDGEMAEPNAFLGAFLLVACDYGPDCLALNREALNACAYAGYCDARTYEDLYQNFLASPFAYAQAMRYRSIIHDAIATRNWALIGLTQKSGPFRAQAQNVATAKP